MMSKLVQTFDEINITPLTDIFLVLLIIMMVVAPSLAQNQQPLKLPDIKAGAKYEASSLAVDIDPQGAFTLAGAAVANVAALEASLKQQLPTAADKKLVVRADKNTPSRYVLDAMQAAAHAGFERVLVAGNPKPTEPPKPQEVPPRG
jgi:biopolymer transport protein ExbD/biopolymer transport protein TolR